MAWGNFKEEALRQTLESLTLNKTKSLIAVPALLPIDSTNSDRFADAIKKNESLTELYLSGQDFGQFSKVIGEAIGNHPNIQTLSIGHNRIGEDLQGFKELFTGVFQSNSITTLSLESKSIGFDAINIISEIVANKNIQITTLNLNDNQLDSRSLEVIGSLMKEGKLLVRDLFLIKNQFGNNQEHSGLSQAFIDQLSNCNNLKKLDLSNNFIGDTGAVYIAKLMKENQSIVELNLSNCQIDKKGAMELGEALMSWKGISFGLIGNLNIQHHLHSIWSPKMNPISNLQSLIIRGCTIGNGGLKTLVEHISNNLLPSLKILDLAYNQITSESLNELSKVLIHKENNSYTPTIEELELSFNTLGSSCKDIICQWLSTNSILTLKDLSLTNCEFKFNDLMDICQSLVSNENSIKTIQIYGNTDKTDSEQNSISHKHSEENHDHEHDHNHEEEEEEEEYEVDEKELDFFDNLQTLIEVKNCQFKWK